MSSTFFLLFGTVGTKLIFTMSWFRFLELFRWWPLVFLSGNELLVLNSFAISGHVARAPKIVQVDL